MTCKNCNNILNDTQKYCDECGAKIIQNRLKPKVLVAQVNEQFICLDNKFLKTFIHLFTQPETVIIGYINGTRKRYIDVLQYFAIALTLAGIQLFIMSTFFKETLYFQNGFADGFNATTNSKENNPFKDLNPDSFNKYQSLIYIATVPFYAFGTWITYYLLRERQFNFTEHIVINLYYYAQVIILTAVTAIISSIFGVDYMLVSSLLILPTIIYLFYILKRIFKDNFWATLLRFIIVGFVAVSLLIIAGMLFAFLVIILS
ncbi:DUF3667 domain-containing protein [Winogradskyella endarachnes]|uniref:DUF3667 domain-containing protein n=1 Tax=Winogradskyella endarachnes TaxID=2681965 RepID=UPI0012F7D707|nr:DUF3667 domain-containing protein [Winogradskyella endarachnes]